ncbi:HAD family hydrolase [Neobacillus sp. NPDC093182]|uniref:HAD family hydrolase n=1 Tax=Neobacillus sp. NPDC093182 TaxID=3364297 RepID=UPI00380F75F5
MKINALVFDLDDTLFKEIDYIFSGYKAVDEWLRETHEISGFNSIATQLFNSGIRKNTFNRSLELLNVSFNENMIIDMVNIYRNHEPDIKLFDDAEWVIRNLASSIKLGLISDGYLTTQEKKVKALKLRERFSSIILSDKFGRSNWKPSPIPYIKSSLQLNSSHHECIYIGDNVSKDFITAKKLGWKTVHISRNDGIYSNTLVSQEYHAHFEIRDLRELQNILDLNKLFDSPNQKVVVE